MKLIDADRGKLILEISSEEWTVIGGVFQMISALQQPGWEDSTGQADTAITPEQFDAVYDALTSLLNGPEGRAFFVGK